MTVRQKLAKVRAAWAFVITIATGLGVLAQPASVLAQVRPPHAIGAPVFGFGSASQPQSLPIDPPALDRRRPSGVAATTNPTTAVPAAAGAAVAQSLDARLLVVSADGKEASLEAIRQTLEYLAVPYTLWVATENPGALTADRLSGGNRGFYQGVILATSNLAYSPDGQVFVSALTPAEWAVLLDYEDVFNVRQVTWYTFPTSDLGFAKIPVGVDTSTVPIKAKLTPKGKEIFSYLNPSATISISRSWTYLTPAGDGTPLLLDDKGNALAVLRSYSDGRENLALTFDSNWFLTHAQALGYGIVNWVTRGVFLGERRVYLSAQVDDLFISSDIFGTTQEYRITGRDFQAAVNWHNARQARPVTANFKLAMAFNGVGTVPGEYPNDTLTPMATRMRDEFEWISHTFTHRELDDVLAAEARSELVSNFDVARRLRFPGFTPATLVTPGITGLSNPEFLRTAYEVGVRYLVSDTSRVQQANPSPNRGFFDALEPGILVIPRRPTNLFYNVSTPTEWMTEYNVLYHSFWGRDLAYEEILDFESDQILRYLLLGDIDPIMFHQANLRAYDGRRSTLSDLLDRAFQKYEALYRLPVLSPGMAALGQRMLARMQWAPGDVVATIIPGRSLTITANRATVVPITGAFALRVPASTVVSRETYGGQPVALIKLKAGETVTLDILP